MWKRSENLGQFSEIFIFCARFYIEQFNGYDNMWSQPISAKTPKVLFPLTENHKDVIRKRLKELGLNGNETVYELMDKFGFHDINEVITFVRRGFK
jgi:hypothetical protein